MIKDSVAMMSEDNLVVIDNENSNSNSNWETKFNKAKKEAKKLAEDVADKVEDIAEELEEEFEDLYKDIKRKVPAIEKQAKEHLENLVKMVKESKVLEEEDNQNKANATVMSLVNSVRYAVSLQTVPTEEKTSTTEVEKEEPSTDVNKDEPISDPKKEETSNEPNNDDTTTEEKSAEKESNDLNGSTPGAPWWVWLIVSLTTLFALLATAFIVKKTCINKNDGNYQDARGLV